MTRASSPRAELVRLADALGQVATPLVRPFDLWGSRLAAPRLVPITAAQAAQGAEELGRLMRWVDDGHCFSRATLGAARMDELLGGAIGGPSDAVRAAVAWVPTSQRSTPWTFHAAMVVRSAEDDALKVIDQLQAAPGSGGIMRLDDWARSVHRSADDVIIQHATDNVPLGAGKLSRATGGADYRRMARDLASSMGA